VDQAERDFVAKLIGDVLVSPDLPLARVRSGQRFPIKEPPRVSVRLVDQ
jgi:hypothetical protein